MNIHPLPLKAFYYLIYPQLPFLEIRTRSSIPIPWVPCSFRSYSANFGNTLYQPSLFPLEHLVYLLAESAQFSTSVFRSRVIIIYDC